MRQLPPKGFLAHKRNQPWFDKSCKSLRAKTLQALRLFRRNHSTEALQSYQSLKKAYRNLTSSKKSDYINTRTLNLKRACDDKDPRTFWNALKDGAKHPPCLISVQEWFEYFF